MPWLLGLLVISWLGNYPEPAAGNQGVLEFSTAIPVIFVFSVVIYALAMRFPLSTEEIEEHVEQSRKESELEEKALGEVAADPVAGRVSRPRPAPTITSGRLATT